MKFLFCNEKEETETASDDKHTYTEFEDERRTILTNRIKFSSAKIDFREENFSSTMNKTLNKLDEVIQN